MKNIDVALDKIAVEHYTEYSIAVLEDRAIPDYRDGMLPVNRRALWAAYKLGIHSKAKHVKAARIVGECFAEGTLVTLEGGGQIPIEQVTVGDIVKTDAGDFPVTQLYELHQKVLYEVQTDKGTVQATADQIFFCLDSKGREVKRTPLTLKPGDRILSL